VHLPRRSIIHGDIQTCKHLSSVMIPIDAVSHSKVLRSFIVPVPVPVPVPERGHVQIRGHVEAVGGRASAAVLGSSRRGETNSSQNLPPAGAGLTARNAGSCHKWLSRVAFD